MGSAPSGFSRLSIAATAMQRREASPAGDPAVRASHPRVGVIRNPRSHRNKQAAAPIPGIPDDMMVEPRTKQELEEALARFTRREIRILAISGGDGTVRDVLTRGAPLFKDNWPTIIVLPQGKTNALALDLGISKKWTLEAALCAAAQGRTVARRPLVIEHAEGKHRPRFGFILGAGVFNAAIDAGQVAHRFGAFQSFAVGVTAVFGVAQALFGFGNTPWRKLSGIRIKPEGGAPDLPHSRHGRTGTRLLAGFTTLSTFPLGLHPFSHLPDDGLIRYFFLDAPLRRAVALIPVAAFGPDSDYLRDLGILRGSTSDFAVEFDDNFILDGESYPAGNYSVRQGPELHFVVP